MAKVTECKTMFARMENVKLGKLDEFGVGINDVEKALDRVDIPLRDSVDSFRSMEDVMGDIAEKWDTLTEVEQASLSTTIAGVRQRENFLVLMQNWGQSLELQEVQFESAGLAADRYDIYLQNLEASSNRLTASWENLWNETISSETIIFFQDLTSSILELATALGGLVPILSAVFAYLVAANIGTIAVAFINLGNAIMLAMSQVSVFVGLTAIISPAMQVALAVYAIAVAFKKLKSEIEETKKTYEEMIDLASGRMRKVVKDTDDLTRAFQGWKKEIRRINSAMDDDWIARTFLGAKIAKDAINLLSDSIIDLSKNHDEYEKTMLRALLMTGNLTNAEENLVRARLKNEELTAFQISRMEILIEEYGLLSKAELLYATNPEVFDRVRSDTGQMEHLGQAIEGVIDQYQGLSDILKTLQSESGVIADIAQKSMAGEVTFDDIQKLAEIYPNYLDALEVENGLITVNTDLLREYNTQKAEEALADARARLALDETNESLQKEVMLLENYVEQTERAIPLSREFSENLQNILLGIEDLPDELEEFAGQIYNLSEQFENGTLTASEYFETLHEQISGLADMDMAGMLGDDSGAQAMFSGLVLDATQALSQISSEFDAGIMPISDYTEQIVGLSDIFVDLGNMFVESGIEGASDEVTNSIDQVVDGQKRLAGMQELNQQLMGQTWLSLEVGSEQYQAYARNVANAAWQASEASGQAFTDMAGSAYESADGIYKSLISGNENFNNLASQAASRTSENLGKVMGGVSTLLVSIGNAISNFDFSMNIIPEQIPGTTWNFLGIGIPVPGIKLKVSTDADTSSVASTIGSAISTFGASLGDLDFSFDANIYAQPINQVSQYAGNASDAFDSVTDSVNDAIDATLDLSNATSDLKDQIEDLRKSAQDTLKDQLKGYKDLIDQQKALLKLKDKEREYQNDVDDKQKDILHIQAEIDELKFDDTQEAIARRLALEADLAKQERDLEDLQQKHSTDIQIAALDAEYAQFERSIQAKIDAIELIDATSIDDFIMKLQDALATSASVPMYHGGVDAGFVGGKSASLGNEQFAKLMSGELVINPDQMNKFMSYTLPKMTQVSSGDMMGGMSFENLMSIVVQGNLDPDVLPKLEKIATQVVEKINKDMSNRGYKRNASKFSI